MTECSLLCGRFVPYHDQEAARNDGYCCASSRRSPHPPGTERAPSFSKVRTVILPSRHGSRNARHLGRDRLPNPARPRRWEPGSRGALLRSLLDAWTASRRLCESVRVLITGVSGSGKSSLVHELRRRGLAAYDADDDGFSEPSRNGAWAWRVDLVQQLLDDRREDLVFFAGCSDEQTQYSFDRTVLLTAPVDVIAERLRTRTTNSYGKSPDEIDRIVA